jgi:hypothetical protein
MHGMRFSLRRGLIFVAIFAIWSGAAAIMHEEVFSPIIDWFIAYLMSGAIAFLIGLAGYGIAGLSGTIERHLDHK